MRPYEKPTIIPAEIVMRVHQVTGRGVMDVKLFLQDATPLFYSRFMEAVRIAQETGLNDERRCLLRDPIEEDSEFVAIFQEASRLAGAELEATIEEFFRTLPETLQCLRGRGQIHLYSAILQRTLREHYGIEWFTLQQMNPHVTFD